MVSTSAPMPLAAVGDVATIDVRGYGSATVTFEGGTTALAGGTVLLEATNVDNPAASDYVPVVAAASASPTGATSTPLSNGALAPGQTSSNAYRLNTAGYTYVRARMTARTSGDILAQWSRDTIPVEPVPSAPSGVVANPPTGQKHTLLSTASTNRVLFNGSACVLDELSISNPTATPAFLKLYDKASVNTSGDTGNGVLLAIIPVPANSFQQLSFPTSGKRFTSGLGVALTGAAADNDDTATVAGIRLSLTRR